MAVECDGLENILRRLGGKTRLRRVLRRSERRWLLASGEVDEWLEVSFRRLDDRSDVPRSGCASAVHAGRYPAPGQEGRAD